MTHSLRSLLVALAVAVLLGTASAAPTAADDPIIAALPGSEDPEDSAAPSASAQAPDRTLRPGCRSYPLRYAVKRAGEDWLLNLEVVDRDGERVAHLNLHGVDSPRKGTARFTVCRSTISAGRFQITGILTDREGYQQSEHPVEGGRFWLRRR